MALYVYQGMWNDTWVLGGNVVWPALGASGVFSVVLIQDHISLDTSSGLNAKGILNWGTMDSQASIEEMPTAGTNYSRFDLPVAGRSSNWDSGENTGELELKYDNATYPITWPNLTSGYTIGAYAIVRTVDGSTGDIMWMADSGATGLPATTNGEDFTITLNAEAFMKGFQPNQA